MSYLTAFFESVLSFTQPFTLPELNELIKENNFEPNLNSEEILDLLVDEGCISLIELKKPDHDVIKLYWNHICIPIKDPFGRKREIQSEDVKNLEEKIQKLKKIESNVDKSGKNT
ncbi:hypothetical protein HZS_5346, partial [Henneguya salminicola]